MIDWISLVVPMCSRLHLTPRTCSTGITRQRRAHVAQRRCHHHRGPDDPQCEDPRRLPTIVTLPHSDLNTHNTVCPSFLNVVAYNQRIP